MKRKGLGPVPLFLAAEGVLYAIFLYLDLSGRGAESAPVKYLSIVLCLAMALSALRGVEGRLTAAALAFTLLADTFLLLLEARLLIGVASFCAVQLLYLVRIRRSGGWPKPLCLLLRMGLTGGGLALLGGLGALNLLTGLAAGYFSQLLCNALESFSLWRRGRRGRLLALGLCLFVGCDLCVGLHNLPNLLAVNSAPAVFAWARVGMWFFYLPSQVLLTLSGRAESSQKGGMP